MNRKQKKMLWRIIASSLLFAISCIPFPFGIINNLLLLSAYVISGYDILHKAVRNTFKGNMFDENFLMALATVSALVTSQYHEAVFVMVFYQTGELFQSIATHKSRKSIAKLMEICPDSAYVEIDGKLVRKDPSEIEVGDVIIVRPGEKIALDGVVTDGASEINTANLTGESLPRAVKVGDSVANGCINISGVISVKVTRPFSQSTVTKILEMTENAALGKAKTERFITRFAKYYTPGVVIFALLLATLPPLFIDVTSFAVWKDWIYRAMTLLVISCPCALVISVPLSFFSGIGALSRCGVLVKGGSSIEALAKCDVFVFDKTGTLTTGEFQVKDVFTINKSQNEVLSIAAALEHYSNHPLAKTICKKMPLAPPAENVSELSGYGIIGEINGDRAMAGNIMLMKKYNIDCVPELDETTVYIVLKNKLAGVITFEDKIKNTSKTALQTLKALGIKRTVMLTGDKKEIADKVSSALNVDETHAQLLPQHKLEKIEDIIRHNPQSKVAFVGDGINDAPSLARADVGIAMGKLGTEAASEAADVVLMDDDPQKIAIAVKKCRKTTKIVMQNIWFVLAVKFAAIILGAAGITGMWFAVFADVGVAAIAILNSMRNK